MSTRGISLPLSPIVRSIHWGFVLRAIFAMLVAAIAYLYVSTHWMWFAADWSLTYYPATMNLIHGVNPYLVTTLHNPVWVLLPLIPMALLGVPGGAAVLYVLSYLCYAFAASRLKASPLAFVAFLVCPLMVYGAAVINVDAWLLVGLFLPPPVALFFAAIKPQLGLVPALYFAYSAWKQGGLRRVAITFAPVTLAYLLSFVLLGNWLAGRSDDIMNTQGNVSLFPWSLPLGLWLTYTALKKQRISDTLIASACVTPYLTMWSWGVALIALLKHERVMLLTSLGLWALAFASAHQWFLTGR